MRITFAYNKTATERRPEGWQYIAVCTYAEKDIPKSAGFRWNPADKCWWTAEADIASTLQRYMDAVALSAANLSATEEAIQMQLDAMDEAASQAAERDETGDDAFQPAEEPKPESKPQDVEPTTRPCLRPEQAPLEEWMVRNESLSLFWYYSPTTCKDYRMGARRGDDGRWTISILDRADGVGLRNSAGRMSLYGGPETFVVSDDLLAAACETAVALMQS